MKILVAVDGSKSSLKAVQMLIDRVGWYRSRPEVELVAVHRPLPTMRGVSKGQAEKYYAEESASMLAAARRKLDGAGIAYQPRALVGPVAETIVRHAKDKRCDLIVIGTRGMGELKSALIGSIATKVLHLADRPVLTVK